MISCPFSNSTRNIALDNASLIIPSCSIEACLAIYYLIFPALMQTLIENSCNSLEYNSFTNKISNPKPITTGMQN
jgi:hypothetical protein